MDNKPGATLADTSPFHQVPIEITVSVGHARPLLKACWRCGAMRSCRSTAGSTTR